MKKPATQRLDEILAGERLYERGFYKTIADYSVGFFFNDDDTAYFGLSRIDDVESFRGVEVSTTTGLSNAIEEAFKMLIEAEPWEDDFAYLRNKLEYEVDALKAFDEFKSSLYH